MVDLEKIKLSEFKIRWVSGILRCRGIRLTYDEVVTRLKRKYPDLTPEDCKQIIYSKLESTVKVDRMTLEKQKFALTQKRLDIEWVRANEKRLERKEREKGEKVKVQLEKKRLKQLEEGLASQPSDFGCELYSRMNVDLVFCAIQSKYDLLTVQDCRRILGSWVRRSI